MPVIFGGKSCRGKNFQLSFSPEGVLNKTNNSFFFFFHFAGDVELAAKLEDELKHEKASGLEDLDSSVQNIQYVLQNNAFEVCPQDNDIAMK